MNDDADAKAKAPVLLLIPGLDGTGLMFANLLTTLGSRIDAQVVSYPTDGAANYHEAEAFVRSKLPELVGDRPFFAVGESFSGPVALALAANPPSGLRGIILCATFAKNPRPFLGLFKAIVDHLPLERLPAVVFEFFLFGGHGSPQDHQALRDSFAALQPRVLRSRAQAVLSVDLSPLVDAVKVPVLYLHSQKDRIVPDRCLNFFRQHLPDCEVVHFDAPHLILQVRPHESAAAILDFVTKRME